MPEGLALQYLFFAYSAVFIILIAFVARSFVNIRRIETELKRMEQSEDEQGA